MCLSSYCSDTCCKEQGNDEIFDVFQTEPVLGGSESLWGHVHFLGVDLKAKVVVF